MKKEIIIYTAFCGLMMSSVLLASDNDPSSDGRLSTFKEGLTGEFEQEKARANRDFRSADAEKLHQKNERLAKELIDTDSKLLEAQAASKNDSLKIQALAKSLKPL